MNLFSIAEKQKLFLPLHPLYIDHQTNQNLILILPLAQFKVQIVYKIKKKKGKEKKTDMKPYGITNIDQYN